MIDNFTGTYRFLSNFYRATVILGDMTYSSVEHAFQAAKTLDEDERLQFHRIIAGEAKKLGRKIKIRSDWEEIKNSIMLELLHDKFQIPELRMLLKMTEPEELVEGNTWGDTYWGVCNGVGQNKLGKLLMQVRDNI